MYSFLTSVSIKKSRHTKWFIRLLLSAKHQQPYKPLFFSQFLVIFAPIAGKAGCEKSGALGENVADRVLRYQHNTFSFP